MARSTSMEKTLPGLWRILVYFWPWIRKERPLILTSMLALGGGVLLRLAEPWPLKFVLDRVLPTNRPVGMRSLAWIDSLDPMTLLTVCAVAVVAVSGLRAMLDYHQRIGFAKVGIRVLRQVRNHVYVHLQSLSLSFHNRSRSGDLIIRVTRDVSLLRDVTSTAILPLLASAMVLVGMLVVMSMLQWQLALVSLVVVPVFLVATARIGRGIHQAARKQRKREGAMAATAAESIVSIRDVQALSLEESFAEDFTNQNARSQREDMKAARLSASLGRTVDALLAVATALVLWYGARLVLKSALTPGDLIVFLAYLRRAFKPARDFAKHTGRLAKATAAGERVLSLLDQVPEIRDMPGAVSATRIRGSVRFDGVGFEYSPDNPVLRDIDFTVEPGQLVAITGPSGSGKSTLISLLLRLYDPSRGRVLIDGKDLREYSVASLRSQISVVLQDMSLFSTTLWENISCGLPEATREQVEAAARLANAHEFIMKLPDGYDTVVGERGSTLSQGQRQRISLARAAIRQAPILILDEPTTGLDEENAREVADALRQQIGGTTTFLLTHDLRLAELADLVIVLEDTIIVERGAPGKLIEAGNRFGKLYRKQTALGRTHDA